LIPHEGMASEKDIDGEEYLPNPYQAEAEAQVRAGAWPGALLLQMGSAPNSPQSQAILPGQQDSSVSDRQQQEARGAVDPAAVAALLMGSPPGSPLQQSSPVTSPFGSFVAKPTWTSAQVCVPVACVVGPALTSPAVANSLPGSPFAGSPVIASPVASPLPGSPMGSFVARPMMQGCLSSASVKGLGSAGGSSSRPNSGSPCSNGRRRRRLGSSVQLGDAIREMGPPIISAHAECPSPKSPAPRTTFSEQKLPGQLPEKSPEKTVLEKRPEKIHRKVEKASEKALEKGETASHQKVESLAEQELDKEKKKGKNKLNKEMSTSESDKRESLEVSEAPWSFLPEFRVGGGLPTASQSSSTRRRRSSYESPDSSDEGDVDADAAPDTTDCSTRHNSTSPSPCSSTVDGSTFAPPRRKRLGSITGSTLLSGDMRGRDMSGVHTVNSVSPQVVQSEPSPPDSSDGPGGLSPTEENASGGSTRKLSHLHVPKSTDLTKKFGTHAEEQEITTLMVRNIPNLYTRTMLIEELDSLGFRGEFNFIYLPIDKSTEWNVGYAFVNFVDSNVAAQFTKIMTNYKFCQFDHGSGKVAQVSVAHIQGLQKNLEHYSNTAVQCARVQSHRPLVLAGGSKDKSRRSPQKRRSGRNRHQPRLAQVAQDSSEKQVMGQDASQPWEVPGHGFYHMDPQVASLHLQAGMPYVHSPGSSAANGQARPTMVPMGDFGFVPYKDAAACGWFSH